MMGLDHYIRHGDMAISYIRHATWGPSDTTGGGKSKVTCNIAIS